MLNQKKVLIAGGSGFIGLKLAKLLTSKNFKVAILSRSQPKSSNYETFKWNIKKQFIEKEAFRNTDYIINLAGANIAGGRWTKKRKKEILESRVESTNLLLKYVQKEHTNLKAYIAVSATGYYGNKTTDQIFNETQDPGNDFLANVCYQWEQASLAFKKSGIRTVILRSGVVFDKDEGAFPKMTQSLKFGFISGVGSGKQYIPWIHVNDLLVLFLFCTQNDEMQGIYNAVAPSSITQDGLVSRIKSMNKVLKLPNLPAFILKLFLGEMASILLYGSRVSANKLSSSGFRFKLDSIEDALEKLL